MADQAPTKGTIKEGEYHPMADSAMEWFRSMPFEKLMMAREAIASSALSGNRVAEICHETLERLTTGQPVSDRYLLGLCWLLRDMQDDKRI